mmetsp:Transcript_12576/g.35077  ORF Transcript_12576/g.35077 Transcript_12576/m.35077 type:complete len:81 (+) Transcript_12576:3045-3287(+)
MPTWTRGPAPWSLREAVPPAFSGEDGLVEEWLYGTHPQLPDWNVLACQLCQEKKVYLCSKAYCMRTPVIVLEVLVYRMQL